MEGGNYLLTRGEYADLFPDIVGIIVQAIGGQIWNELRLLRTSSIHYSMLDSWGCSHSYLIEPQLFFRIFPSAEGKRSCGCVPEMYCDENLEDS